MFALCFRHVLIYKPHLYHRGWSAWYEFRSQCAEQSLRMCQRLITLKLYQEAELLKWLTSSSLAFFSPTSLAILFPKCDFSNECKSSTHTQSWVVVAGPLWDVSGTVLEWVERRLCQVLHTFLPRNSVSFHNRLACWSVSTVVFFIFHVAYLKKARKGKKSSDAELHTYFR